MVMGVVRRWCERVAFLQTFCRQHTRVCYSSGSVCSAVGWQVWPVVCAVRWYVGEWPATTVMSDCVYRNVRLALPPAFEPAPSSVCVRTTEMYECPMRKNPQVNKAVKQYGDGKCSPYKAEAETGDDPEMAGQNRKQPTRQRHFATSSTSRVRLVRATTPKERCQTDRQQWNARLPRANVRRCHTTNGLRVGNVARRRQKARRSIMACP